MKNCDRIKNNNIYRYPMSTSIMHHLKIFRLKTENARLLRRAQILEKELQHARNELEEIKSCRDCTFIGCRQCAKEKPCDAK